VNQVRSVGDGAGHPHQQRGADYLAPLDIMAEVKRNAGKAGAGQVPVAIDSLVAAIGARYATPPSSAPVRSGH
jgi:hypothetical protein